MDSNDVADILRVATDAYRGGFRVTGGASQPSPSQILDRSREAAQRDILMAAMAKLSERLHGTLDEVGCAILQRIISDARYKVAEIEVSRPKAAR